MTPNEIQDLIAALRAAGVRRFKQGDLEIELDAPDDSRHARGNGPSAPFSGNATGSGDPEPAAVSGPPADPDLVAREVLAETARKLTTSPTARDIYEEPGLWPGGRVPRFPEQGALSPKAQYIPKE